MKKFIKPIEGFPFPIGQKGENLARRVDFSDTMKEMVTEYGEAGKIVVLVQRPKESECYPAAHVEISDETLIWTPDSTDTAIAGLGKVQIDYYIGEVLAKSKAFEFRVLYSIGAVGSVPDPGYDYIKKILDAKSTPGVGIESVTNNPDSSLTFTLSDGRTYTTEPLKGKDGADGKDGLPGADGTDGKDGLPGADGKDGLPGADGKDGKDGLPGADGKDGLPGADGKAATIKIGTVTTGDAGSQAAVVNSGTENAAVFDFTIPKGDKGDKGDTAESGGSAYMAGNGIYIDEKTKKIHSAAYAVDGTYDKENGTAVTIGTRASGQSYGENSLTVGTGVIADSPNSVALGGDANTRAYNEGSVAITGGSARGENSTAIGFGMANSLNSVAIGANSQANNGSAIAIGYNAMSAGQSAITLGPGSYASGERSVAVGCGAIATGGYSTAVGYGARTDYTLTASIGVALSAGKANQTVYGIHNVEDTEHPVVIGCGTEYATRKNGLTIDTNGNVDVYAAVRPGRTNFTLTAGEAAALFGVNALQIAARADGTACTMDLTGATGKGWYDANGRFALSVSGTAGMDCTCDGNFAIDLQALKTLISEIPADANARNLACALVNSIVIELSGQILYASGGLTVADGTIKRSMARRHTGSADAQAITAGSAVNVVLRGNIPMTYEAY